MQDILGESLRKLKRIRVRRSRIIAIILVLSLIVSLDVFWVLRQPALTLAGDADCGIVEHAHDASCQSGDSHCHLEEHTHTLACYTDETADVESQLDWQKMFADYPYSGDLPTDLAGIAKTQVGYAESTENFAIGSDGIRRGYTRYGAWYGAPYADWSAMFVSFCLHHAGADPTQFPANTGAAPMAEYWKKCGYLIDPHTAVAVNVMEQYRAATGDDTVTVVVSTASPYKFGDSVLEAIGEKPVENSLDRLEQMNAVTGVEIPRRLAALRGKPRRFEQVCGKLDMEAAVLEFLK